MLVNIPISENPNEQLFLEQTAQELTSEQRPEFLGYLRKYQLTVDEARQFLIYFKNNQISEFFEKRNKQGRNDIQQGRWAA